MNGDGYSSYAVYPQARTLPDSTITAQVRRHPKDAAWHVLILITRAPDRSPIDAAEVQARLVDENGAALPVLLGPLGPLPEAGGSLGVSANARFQFADRGTRLAELVVQVHGAEVRFRLTLP
jgi:hypothetical protein